MTSKGKLYFVLRIFILLSLTDNSEALQALRTSDQVAFKQMEERIQRIKGELNYPLNEQDQEIQELKVNEKKFFFNFIVATFGNQSGNLCI